MSGRNAKLCRKIARTYVGRSGVKERSAKWLRRLWATLSGRERGRARKTWPYERSCSLDVMSTMAKLPKGPDPVLGHLAD